MGSWIGFTNAPEHLKCPICTEFPRHRILQCGNDHKICSDCYTKVNKICPQCRVKFEFKDVRRNPLLEADLDAIEFNCPFAGTGGSGCNTKVTRQTIYSHLETCSENSSNKLCHILGFDKCNYAFKCFEKGIGINNVEHLALHGIELDQLTMSTDFKVLIKPEVFNEGSQTHPIIAMKIIQNKFYAVLLLSVANKRDKCFAVLPFVMNYNNNRSAHEILKVLRAELRIDSLNDELAELPSSSPPAVYLKQMPVQWITKPIPIYRVGEVLQNNCVMDCMPQFPMSSMEKYCQNLSEEKMLMVQCKLKFLRDIRGNLEDNGGSAAVAPSSISAFLDLSVGPENPNPNLWQEMNFRAMFLGLEVALMRPRPPLKWISHLKPRNTDMWVLGGKGPSHVEYVARAKHSEELGIIPGKLCVEIEDKEAANTKMSIPLEDEIFQQEYEILTAPEGSVRWIKCPRKIPEAAVIGGQNNRTGKYFYIGRISIPGIMACGKVNEIGPFCDVTFGSSQVSSKRFEILVYTNSHYNAA